MEPNDLLCSRNAWEEKGSLVVLLLAERARSECARSTRAVEDQSTPIPKARYRESEDLPSVSRPALLAQDSELSTSDEASL